MSMAKRKKFSSSLVLAVVVVFFVCLIGITGVSAQSESKPGFKPVADEMIGSSGITWVPKINYARLVLTISRPDGTVFRTTFDSGKTPYIDLSSLLACSFSDGSYTYELRVIPPGVQKFHRESELKAVSGERLKSNKALTQSGYFFVQGGAIVRPDQPEGSTRQPAAPGSGRPDTGQEGLSGTADICYVDDLIVDGSLCVGADCVCNYSFGFDTIVLTENNLRIFFDDTSNTDSFPRNDWRIVINDTANGGANYFGVEDSSAGRRVFTLEAGAPSHSLYVDDGGRVGMGTSTPAMDVHIVSGNTPTLRLDQDGASGFTPQVWDVAGNEISFFIRDATHASKLPFRIETNAPGDLLTLKSDGKVGIGTWGPSFPVHLKTDSSTNAAIVAERTNGATNFMNATDTRGVFGTTTDHNLRLVRNSAFQMDLVGNSDIAMQDGGGYNGTWNPASSRELKENIKGLTVDDAIEALVGLNPVTYNYKDNKEEPRVGFIAEDVPELVAMKGRKTLGTVDILSVLTKVLQEQQKALKKQHEIISQLNDRVAELEKKSK